MAEWIGQLIAGWPVWAVIVVILLVALIWFLYYTAGAGAGGLHWGKKIWWQDAQEKHVTKQFTIKLKNRARNGKE